MPHNWTRSATTHFCIMSYDDKPETAAQSAESRGPAIEAESFMVASEKMTRLRRRTGTASGRTGTTDTTSAPLPVEASAAVLAATLEKELDHCIREIIMYKLDVKGKSLNA